jgi:hypothetical protein
VRFGVGERLLELGALGAAAAAFALELDQRGPRHLACFDSSALLSLKLVDSTLGVVTLRNESGQLRRRIVVARKRSVAAAEIRTLTPALGVR